MLNSKLQGENMSDRAKDILVKASVVASIVFFALIFIQIPFLPNSLSDNELLDYYRNGWIRWFISVGVMAFLVFRFGIKLKPVESEKMPLPLRINTYDAFSEWFAKKIIERGYEECCFSTADRELSRLFIMKASESLWAFLIAKENELTEEKLDIINEQFGRFLFDYYESERITDRIFYCSIICVDRATPDFYTYVNSNILQDFNLIRLPAGISFGEKTLFIAKQKSEIGIGKYKELRKEFLEIIADLSPAKPVVIK